MKHVVKPENKNERHAKIEKKIVTVWQRKGDKIVEISVSKYQRKS